MPFVFIHLPPRPARSAPPPGSGRCGSPGPSGIDPAGGGSQGADHGQNPGSTAEIRGPIRLLSRADPPALCRCGPGRLPDRSVMDNPEKRYSRTGAAGVPVCEGSCRR